MYGKAIIGMYRLLSQSTRRDDFLKHHAELEKSQYLPAEEIRNIQLKKLNALLNHAYDNVPYYRRWFAEAGLKPSDIKTTDDLTKLPVLTKEDIRTNSRDLVAVNFPRENMLPYSTSGSTGEPLRFYITREVNAQKHANIHRTYRWCGYKMGDMIAYVWFIKRGFMAKQISNLHLSLFRGRFYLDPLNMSQMELKRFVIRIKRYRPSLIVAYPSAAYILAGYIKSNNIKGFMLKAVITGGEMLFDYQRQAIKQAFNCEVFDGYGSREVGLIAHQHPGHDSYHICAESLVLEFIKDGKAVPNGETGKVLVTDLTNYAMPFIRYENGDLGVLTSEKCRCSVNLPSMKPIEGRIEDIIVTKDKLISSLAINPIFNSLPINQYQIVQETEDEILVKIVKGDGYTEAVTENVIKLLPKYISTKVKFHIIFADHIPLTPSGKHRFVISKIPVRFK